MRDPVADGGGFLAEGVLADGTRKCKLYSSYNLFQVSI